MLAACSTTLDNNMVLPTGSTPYTLEGAGASGSAISALAGSLSGNRQTQLSNTVASLQVRLHARHDAVPCASAVRASQLTAKLLRLVPRASQTDLANLRANLARAGTRVLRGSGSSAMSLVMWRVSAPPDAPALLLY